METTRTNRSGNHNPAPQEASLQVKQTRMKYGCAVKGCHKHIRASVTTYTDSPGCQLLCAEHAADLIETWCADHPGFRCDSENPGISLYWADSTAGPVGPDATEYRVKQPTLFGASESLFGADCPSL